MQTQSITALLLRAWETIARLVTYAFGAAGVVNAASREAFKRKQGHLCYVEKDVVTRLRLITY